MLQSLPEEIRVALLQATGDPNQVTLIAQALKLTTYRGNLVPPEMIQEYDRVLPGSGRMFLDIFKERSDLQIELDRKHANAVITRAYVGQGFSFVVALACIGAAAAIVWYNPDSYVAAIFALLLACVGVGGPGVARLISEKIKASLKLRN